MTADNNKTKYEVWGQWCLLIAVVLNAFILVLNFCISSADRDLERTRRNEQYHMRNDQIAYWDNVVGTVMEGSSFELEMMRRLTEGQLLPAENETLKQRVEKLYDFKERSFRHFVMGTYFIAKDPPKGMTMEEYFAGISNDSLAVLYPKFDKEAKDSATSLKTNMNRLSDKLSYLKIAQIILMSANMIAVLLGSIFMFRASKHIRAEMAKLNT